MDAVSITTADVPRVKPTPAPDPVFDAWNARVAARLAALGDGPLFSTDATGLFDAFLSAVADVQHHRCHCCRRFLETYGGLATIDDAGVVAPALWDASDDAIPGYYFAAGATLSRLVRRANVTGVFLSAAPAWGQATAGGWTHLAATPAESRLYRRPLLTASQAMAEKAEDYKNVQRALAEFPEATVAEAVRLLESETLYRSEKVAGPARWLLDLHRRRSALRGRARDNAVWSAVATAPPGFCHPRSSMVGTLLEDLAAGMGFEAAAARFASKMHPLQYQRPQAPPSAGNIARGEEVVARLGLAPSLERRYARMDEVEAIWRAPAPAVAPPGAGVFSHLTPRGRAPAPRVEAPAIPMTWEKFARVALPGAEAIELFVDHGRDNYAALLTAVHADAPPILQWDRPERRNPVSWYLYHGGSDPAHWGLAAGRYCPVPAIARKPSQWGPDPDAFAHQGKGVLLLLEGARDTREAGLCLFPETLKAELREVRATIEAHSQSRRLPRPEGPVACGLLLQAGGRWSARLRVRSADGAAQEYILDRWD